MEKSQTTAVASQSDSVAPSVAAPVEPAAAKGASFSSLLRRNAVGHRHAQLFRQLWRPDFQRAGAATFRSRRFARGVDGRMDCRPHGRRVGKFLQARYRRPRFECDRDSGGHERQHCRIPDGGTRHAGRNRRDRPGHADSQRRIDRSFRLQQCLVWLAAGA